MPSFETHENERPHRPEKLTTGEGIVPTTGGLRDVADPTQAKPTRRAKDPQCPRCRKYRSRARGWVCEACEREDEARRKRLLPHHGLEQKKRKLVDDFKWRRSDYTFNWRCPVCPDPFMGEPHNWGSADKLIEHLHLYHPDGVQTYLEVVAGVIRGIRDAKRGRKRPPVDPVHYAFKVFDLREPLATLTGSRLRDVFGKWPPWVCEPCMEADPAHPAFSTSGGLIDHLQAEHGFSEDKALREFVREHERRERAIPRRLRDARETIRKAASEQFHEALVHKRSHGMGIDYVQLEPGSIPEETLRELERQRGKLGSPWRCRYCPKRFKSSRPLTSASCAHI